MKVKIRSQILAYWKIITRTMQLGDEKAAMQQLNLEVKGKKMLKLIKRKSLTTFKMLRIKKKEILGREIWSQSFLQI